MASEASICSAGLKLLGESSITSLTEDNVAAIACNESYERLRDAELRKHPWNFSIQRASLAASATAPIFGRTNYFPVPSDFLRLLPLDPEDNLNSTDWQLENQGGTRVIATNDAAPLAIRYVAKVTDPNTFDPLFQDALAARIAEVNCEAITQSNAKKVDAHQAYRDAIAEAKRINGFENVAQEPPQDVWITARM